MAYDVDTWETKELLDLAIPVASLYKHHRKDWHPRRFENDDGTVTFSPFAGSEINGMIDGDMLRVTAIKASGEGSGTSLNWIIEPALADSTGRLVAVRVWEGGDSIDRLTVINGIVTTEGIDL